LQFPLFYRNSLPSSHIEGKGGFFFSLSWKEVMQLDFPPSKLCSRWSVAWRAGANSFSLFFPFPLSKTLGRFPLFPAHDGGRGLLFPLLFPPKEDRTPFFGVLRYRARAALFLCYANVISTISIFFAIESLFLART